jgi:hypothetical protein
LYVLAFLTVISIIGLLVLYVKKLLNESRLVKRYLDSLDTSKFDPDDW